MATQSPPECGTDPMVLFRGKRAAQRIRIGLNVACSAASGTSIAARTVDMSTSGALLRLSDPSVLSIDANTPLTELALRIAMRFPGGMVLRFQGSVEEVPARVVRVAVPPPPATGVLLGVHFHRGLPATDIARFGLPTGPDPGPASVPPEPTAEEEPPAEEEAPVAEEVSVAEETRVVEEAEAPDSAPAESEAPPLPEPAPAPSPPPPPPASPPRPTPTPSEAPATAPVVANGAPQVSIASNVHVYLFPTNVAAPSARLRVTTLGGVGLALVADLTLPAEEQDPIGVGAFLGERARLVLVAEGRVTYDGTMQVERLVPQEGGILRVHLKAERALPSGGTAARTDASPAVASTRLHRV